MPSLIVGETVSPQPLMICSTLQNFACIRNHLAKLRPNESREQHAEANTHMLNIFSAVMHYVISLTGLFSSFALDGTGFPPVVSVYTQTSHSINITDR